MLMYELPRQIYLRVLGIFVVYLLLFLLWSVDKILRRQNVISKARNDLSDQRLITQDAEKVYIYSKEDKIVCWEDVEEHCYNAEANGWRTTKEEFKKSHHVRHVQVDADRYWGISRRLLMRQPCER